MQTNPFLVDFHRFTPNELEGQGQAIPFSKRFWGDAKYTFGANVVILTPKRDK